MLESEWMLEQPSTTHYNPPQSSIDLDNTLQTLKAQLFSSIFIHLLVSGCLCLSNLHVCSGAQAPLLAQKDCCCADAGP